MGPRFSCRPPKLLGISPIPELLDKRLVIVTGKGGVGKTTVAVALGLRAAGEGKRTIVCEVSSQENASRMFEHTAVGFHEVEMEENLWSISIDPDESMREYVLLQLKVRAMRDMLFRSRIFNYLAAATPGLKELVTIGKIWELAQLDRKVKNGPQVRPGDRRRARHRPRGRLPADAAHLRLDRPRRPDPLAGRRRSTASSPTTSTPAPRSSPCRRRCRSTSRWRWSGTCATRSGSRSTASTSTASTRSASRRTRPRSWRSWPRARTAPRGRRRGRRSRSSAAPAPSAQQLARLKRGVEAPVKTLPFLFEPELGVEAARRALEEALLMASLGEVLDGKSICICAGSGGVGKTTTSAAIATGMAAQGLKVCVLTIDPAKRLADSLGLEELGNEARRVDPALFEEQGVEMKGELWAMMLDAKATFDELIARQAPDEESRDRVLEQPDLPADLQRPGRLAGVHGDGEAVRAAHRRRASTCSSSTRRRPATRSTSSTRRNG